MEWLRPLTLPFGSDRERFSALSRWNGFTNVFGLFHLQLFSLKRPLPKPFSPANGRSIAAHGWLRLARPHDGRRSNEACKQAAHGRCMIFRRCLLRRHTARSQMTRRSAPSVQCPGTATFSWDASDRARLLGFQCSWGSVGQEAYRAP